MASIPATTVVVEDFISGPSEEVRKWNLAMAAIRELQSQGSNLAQGQVFIQGAANTQCELLPFAFDADYIGVAWGRIAGRQPTGFHTGGLPVFKIGAVGDDGYIYASATASLETLQWTSAEIVATPDVKTNTTTKAYRLIGSYTRGLDPSNPIMVQGTCGPVEFDICDLLPA